MNDHIFDSMVAVFSFFAIQIYVTRFQSLLYACATLVAFVRR